MNMTYEGGDTNHAQALGVDVEEAEKSDFLIDYRRKEYQWASAVQEEVLGK
jgi:hypothetical protein